MRRLALALLLCLWAASASAQVSTGNALPSTCTAGIGSLFFVTANPAGMYVCTASNTWARIIGVPTGMITVIASGTCPTGFAEVSALNGKTLIGTVAANGDIGTTGGSDTITPTVAALTAAAQAFTGNSVASSLVSGGTPAGTNATGTVTPLGTNASVTITPLGTNGATTTSGNCAATNLAIGTGAATACKATAPNLAVPAETFTGSSTTVGAQTFTGSSSVTSAEVFTGSALGTHQHTTTATGTNGTSAVTGTLNNFDNRSAFVKVIFCQAS